MWLPQYLSLRCLQPRLLYRFLQLLLCLSRQLYYMCVCRYLSNLQARLHYTSQLQRGSMPGMRVALRYMSWNYNILHFLREWLHNERMEMRQHQYSYFDLHVSLKYKQQWYSEPNKPDNPRPSLSVESEQHKHHSSGYHCNWSYGR